MDWYEEGRRFEAEAADYFMKKHGLEKKWYRKYPLSDNEEDNLVMDEMEKESNNEYL